MVDIRFHNLQEKVIMRVKLSLLALLLLFGIPFAGTWAIAPVDHTRTFE
jgi:hypothetical protein